MDFNAGVLRHKQAEKIRVLVFRINESEEESYQITILITLCFETRRIRRQDRALHCSTINLSDRFCARNSQCHPYRRKMAEGKSTCTF